MSAATLAAEAPTVALCATCAEPAEADVHRFSYRPGSHFFLPPDRMPKSAAILANYARGERARHEITPLDLAAFIARKSSPKWKAPKVRKSAALPVLKPERRQRLQEEWHYEARAAWRERGVLIGEYVREEYEMQTEEEAGQ